MQFNEENTISMGMSIDAEIMVKTDSKEFEYLFNAYKERTPISSVMERFDYGGSFLVVNYHSHVLLGEHIGTQFDLRMVE
jgi:hypothetical protein